MKATIVCLPGDGIGPEVVRATQSVLEAVADAFGHTFEMEDYPIGGIAIDQFQSPLPDFTLQACQNADAVLLGAVGGPQWDDPDAPLRPEQGLLKIRKELGVYANLRPVKPHPRLLHTSPLKPEKIANVDLIFVRELTSGVYFGQPKRRWMEAGEERAVDTMTYTESEVRRIAHLAFQLARQRRRKVTSIDKANVLETSRLWRKVVTEVAREYPDVTLEHLLVDAAAMYLIQRPSSFDILVTENMFGDILTDEASMLAGSMGNMPSASLGEQQNRHGRPRGLYEPIHGSAPDIAGKGMANPVGTILSAALMLRHSLGLEEEAQTLERAVEETLSLGILTPDLGGSANTEAMTRAIIEQLAPSRSPAWDQAAQTIR
ncbi:MAG: 3-isopropylmalate dehydrogenase [Anaerolineales bacterium]|nr:3-isopropylmalate dehydrogenase [Anaerolineales bacterium]MCS7248283.1 3-isopropylmalate dehydrogenase [Anaerolineales bacterium]MDW8162097.1 3-isopropylmalate dehydrogenase [Anaerolineales bacterium]MDW8447414.1 3-isopropylmalate dehydrogenase [Anaerolineales bacterium]